MANRQFTLRFFHLLIIASLSECFRATRFEADLTNNDGCRSTNWTRSQSLHPTVAPSPRCLALVASPAWTVERWTFEPMNPIETLPDTRGHFGPYGGMFVPETLVS